MGETSNIWSDAWEYESDEEWAADKSTRIARGEKIGATLYELTPGGTSGLYHFHHGAEELLLVHSGTSGRLTTPRTRVGRRASR